MNVTTTILGALGLLIASIPIRFTMDMAGDIYKEMFQQKWIIWIQHFKKHINPKTAITTLQNYIEQDIKKTGRIKK